MKGQVKNIAPGVRKPRTTLLASIFVASLILVVVNLVFVNIYSAEDQIYIQQASDLRVLSQEVAKNSVEAVSGSDSAFDDLMQSQDAFISSWQLINEGRENYVDSNIGIKTSLPSREDDIANSRPQLTSLWGAVRINADVVLANRLRIKQLVEISTIVIENVPQIQRNYDQLVDILLDNNSSLSTLAVAQRQAWLSERIALNVNRIIAGDDPSNHSVDQFQRDISLFNNNHESLLVGDSTLGVSRVDDSEARTLLNQVSPLFASIQQQNNSIVVMAPEITKAKAAANLLVSDSELLLAETTLLADYFIQSTGSHIASPELGYGLLLLIVIVICLYGVDMIKLSRYREEAAAEVNKRNNNAVMSLLEEISDLADGDLTTQATVSEDFTGAIADSINYTIDQLRELISAINDVTEQVSESTKSSEETAQVLSTASKRQTSKITAVSNSLLDMEKSINWVSDNAQKSLHVARNSVEIASGGTEAVKNTIRGMDTIRDQIQETSKRIKRLGESSQEIGGFVSIINDIADHTNTLSLNAAIQAAMAGDAGKGFGVVADEVHALAERSSDATRQIEALVKVIQRDINEAVFSMEQTTAEVVEGTQLAQGAGEALDDIETVSKELADLIKNISSAASNQAETSSQITGAMKTIHKITTDTSSGAKATNDYVVELVKQTESLRNAVAGFRLPEVEKKKSAISCTDEIEVEEILLDELDTISIGARYNKQSESARIALV